MFGKLTGSLVTHVLLSNKTLTLTEGHDNIKLLLNSKLGINIDLIGALFLPCFQENLLSVPSLCCADFPDVSIEFKGGYCTF